MEKYTKAVLYVYPLLATVGKDYEEHIRNKALLSYDSKTNAESLIEYIAEEIICKERLEWLKSIVEEVLEKLSDTERALIAIRYFGKSRKLCRFTKTKKDGQNGSNKESWSERMYFRQQQRLGIKVSAMLKAAGLTEERYHDWFSDMEMFKRMERLIVKRRENRVNRPIRRADASAAVR